MKSNYFCQIPLVKKGPVFCRKATKTGKNLINFKVQKMRVFIMLMNCPKKMLFWVRAKKMSKRVFSVFSSQTKNHFRTITSLDKQTSFVKHILRCCCCCCCCRYNIVDVVVVDTSFILLWYTIALVGNSQPSDKQQHQQE